HRGRRRRPLHQPDDRARPDARRRGAGDRPGAVGVLPCRQRDRAAAHRIAPGLRDPEIGYATVFRHRNRGDPLADQSSRHQGRRRGRDNTGPGRGRERHRRRALATGRARHRHAGHARARLAGHPGGRAMTRWIAVAALLLAALSAWAQPYPKGPVHVILPFPAGGGVDAAGRILAQKLSESFGKTFVIENRGGANGNIGTEVAAKSASDGATLLFTGAGFVTNPSLYKSVPYDPVKDF